MIVAAIYRLISYHHTRLYAPTDFRDERCFLEVLQLTGGVALPLVTTRAIVGDNFALIAPQPAATAPARRRCASARPASSSCFRARRSSGAGPGGSDPCRRPTATCRRRAGGSGRARPLGCGPLAEARVHAEYHAHNHVFLGPHHTTRHGDVRMEVEKPDIERILGESRERPSGEPMMRRWVPRLGLSAQISAIGPVSISLTLNQTMNDPLLRECSSAIVLTVRYRGHRSWVRDFS